MFTKKLLQSKKSEDLKKSAAKVLDPKRDTPTRAKHLRIFLDNSEQLSEVLQFFETYYSHIFHIVYDAFIHAEVNLRSKGAHKSQREELEAVLYLLEKVLIYLPEHIGRKWQFDSLTRLMSKLLHPSNSWKLLKNESIRLFLLWYQILGDGAGTKLDAFFATLVPGFISPYESLGIPALAFKEPKIDFQDRERIYDVDEIVPLIPASCLTNNSYLSSMDSSSNVELPDLTTLFLDVLLEHITSQCLLVEWRQSKDLRQMICLEFLFKRFKTFYMPVIFNDFMWKNSLYRPSLELPHERLTAQPHTDEGLGSSMITCRVVVINWVVKLVHVKLRPLQDDNIEADPGIFTRRFLYSCQENVNFIHEIFRQCFLLPFEHATVIKRVIAVYKDWIQMAVEELPPFLIEPDPAYPVRAGLQSVLQIFVTNAANVFLLEVGENQTILLEDQVDMCKRVLNMYRYMVMNIKMDAKTWDQLLFILLHITQLTIKQYPPRRRDESLGGRLAQAIFQTLIVTWIKANLYVVVSTALWDQFVEVLSSLTLWEELIREWFKTMETLTRVLARQVYNLDLNDLPLERLSRREITRKRKSRESDINGRKTLSLVNEGQPHKSPPILSERGPSSPASSEANSASNESTEINHNRMLRFPKHRISTSSVENGTGERKISHILLYRSKSEGNGVYNISPDSRRTRYQGLRRFNSLDLSFEEENDSGHRSSHSPTLSSLDCPSIKYSALHFIVENGGVSQNAEVPFTSSSVSSSSIMAGGNTKGWTAEVASVLWLRMVGSLGDINDVCDTIIHSTIYKYLIELFEILQRIRSNQGISLDNNSTPSFPTHVPPMTIFAPWCFHALQQLTAYHRGKLYALRLLCLLTVRPQDIPLPRIHLVQFYAIIHDGLLGINGEDITNTIIRFTGPRFFTLSSFLSGCAIFFVDFVSACESILATVEVRSGIPRTEAISILGALFSLPDNGQVPLLESSTKLRLIFEQSSELKYHIVDLLLRSGIKEPFGLARCVALSSLGIFLYSEIVHQSFHPKINDAIHVLLLGLRFNNKTVACIACDILLLISDHSVVLTKHFPDIPSTIIEIISATIASLRRSSSIQDELDYRLWSCLHLCLLEWCICVPSWYFNDGKLLTIVFDALLVGCGCDIKQMDNSNTEICSLGTVSRGAVSHLLNHFSFFPTSIGATVIGSENVGENDDNSVSTVDQLTLESLTASYVQLFGFEDDSLLSLLEIEGLPLTVRMILRNLNGKYCWDATHWQPAHFSSSSKQVKDAGQILRSIPPSYASSKMFEANTDDALDDLLKFLGDVSPECRELPDAELNSVAPAEYLENGLEQQVINSILSQQSIEQIHAPSFSVNISEPSFTVRPTVFSQSRLLCSQLGISAWERRSSSNIMQKNSQLLRELKNLDSIRLRETHKIAIIYIAAGQEDKMSIFSNTVGSSRYEHFLLNLAWEVELASHDGFMGGLSTNLINGSTSLYYATSTGEIMFHVATRMPSMSPENILHKIRHLGNDEVHIVWSEHFRDYRRNIFPTAFCDILIVLYPLQNSRFVRVQVNSKPEIPLFGPLYDEAIVKQDVLAGLVRATAVNASRAKRSVSSRFGSYHERKTTFRRIMSQNQLSCSFEDFIAGIVSPGNLNNTNTSKA